MLGSGAILAVARLFPLDRFPLGFCVFRRLTGFPCPTCGFTRAFCDFANGNWGNGIHESPLALVLFIITVAIFVYNALVTLAALCGRRLQRAPIFQFSSGKIVVMVIVFSVLLVANWIYRLGLGLK